MENELGVKSTFFFLNESGKVNLFDTSTWNLHGRLHDIKDPKVVKIIKKLHSGGWEIGLHGSFYSYNNLEMLRKEKKLLEEVLNDKVVGTRQHHLNLSIPETWKYHEKIGLKYDTSLGCKEDVGFKWGTCFPFYPMEDKKALLQDLLYGKHLY